MNKVTGIDVSKATFDVAFQQDGVWNHFEFSNTIPGFRAFSKHIDRDTICVMEATGPYYLKLATYLHKAGFMVSVVNPLVIRRFSQMRLSRTKTDKKDAQLITQYGMTEALKTWSPSSEVCLQLKQLMTVLDGIKKNQTQLKNQLEALNAGGALDPQACKSLRCLNRALQREEEKLEKRIDTLISEHYQEEFQSLTSIPGIGKKAATMLLILTDNFSKFENYKQLIAYLGMSPRIYNSGTSVKGKPRKVINIAVANKLVKQAFAIGKWKSHYSKNYAPNPCF